MRLPADDVAAHTTLGYASTITSAQGVTAGGRDIDGTCHIVGSDQTANSSTSRSPMSKTENHIYFSTAEADPHRILGPKATHPPTAVDILTTILHRDGAQTSAHTAAAAGHDPFTRLPRRRHVRRRANLRRRTHRHAGPPMASIDAAARTIRTGPHRGRSLAGVAAQPHPADHRRAHPIAALQQAAATPLGTSSTPQRCSTGGCNDRQDCSAAERVGPLRWLPAIPDRPPAVGRLLGCPVTPLVAELAEQIRQTARQWHPQ